MEDNILIGGCYKTKAGSWLIVNKRQGANFVCHEIFIDEYGYDEEISEMTESKIREIADLSICYAATYRKGKGLYKVWDQTKPISDAIVLQR